MKEDKKVGVFLDDVYLPDQIPPYIDIWVTVDSLEKFSDYISKYWEQNNKLPEIISFDGCLDSEQELYIAGRTVSAPIFYSSFKKDYGLLCAKWLTEFCKTKDIKLDCKIAVHEPFGQMNYDIQYWIGEHQKEQKIVPTVFFFDWKKIKK